MPANLALKVPSNVETDAARIFSAVCRFRSGSIDVIVGPHVAVLCRWGEIDQITLVMRKE